MGTIICTALGGMLLAWEMPRMLGALLRFADDEPEYALERLLVVWVFCEVGVGLMVPLFRHHYATRLGPPERGDPDEDEGW